MIELSGHTEALARRLAEAQSLTVDETVRQALVAREKDVHVSANSLAPSAEVVAARKIRIRKIAQEIAALPIGDPRSPREIMEDLDPL